MKTDTQEPSDTHVNDILVDAPEAPLIFGEVTLSGASEDSAVAAENPAHRAPAIDPDSPAIGDSAEPTALTQVGDGDPDAEVASSAANATAPTTDPQAEAPNAAEPKRNGQRKATYDGESTPRVLKTAKSLLRADYAGQDAGSYIANKMREAGVNAGPVACEAIRKLVEQQVEGCRKRAFPRIDEAIRRLGEAAIVEELP